MTKTKARVLLGIVIGFFAFVVIIFAAGCSGNTGNSPEKTAVVLAELKISQPGDFVLRGKWLSVITQKGDGWTNTQPLLRTEPITNWRDVDLAPLADDVIRFEEKEYAEVARVYATGNLYNTRLN